MLGGFLLFNNYANRLTIDQRSVTAAIDNYWNASIAKKGNR
jgi:hypothetical protein